LEAQSGRRMGSAKAPTHTGIRRL